MDLPNVMVLISQSDFYIMDFHRHPVKYEYCKLAPRLLLRISFPHKIFDHV